MGKNGFSSVRVTQILLAINPCLPPAQFRHVLGGTRVYHELMIQSRDQSSESNGTALPSRYHNFVQIKALWKELRLSRYQKAG